MLRQRRKLRLVAKKMGFPHRQMTNKPNASRMVGRRVLQDVIERCLVGQPCGLQRLRYGALQFGATVVVEDHAGQRLGQRMESGIVGFVQVAEKRRLQFGSQRLLS